MKRAALTGILGALACGIAACTALVGLGPAPSESQDPDASNVGGPSLVDGGAPQMDGTVAVDAGDATTASEGTDATSDHAIAVDSGPDAGPWLLLSSGAVLRLKGVTTDGWVIYLDPTDSAGHAVSLAGGSPVLVSPDMYYPNIQGSVVLNALNTTPRATLTAWTTATGSHSQPCAGGSPAFDSKVSADGQRLVYPAYDPAQDASSPPYRLLETDPDFSNPIDLGAVNDQFRVYVASDRFVVSRELLAADGGSTSTYTCDAYTNTGVAEHLFDDWCARAAGHEALYAKWQNLMTTTVLIESDRGGAVQSFSPPGDAGPITGYEITPDGGALVFGDSAGNVWSSSIADSTTRLLPNMMGGSTGYILMASDGTHFWFANNDHNVLIASVTDGNAVVPHALGDASINSSAFGTDSRFFVFREGTDLDVLAVDTNVTTHLAENVTCDAFQGYCFLAARDSRIVYLSGGDLWAVDTYDVAHPTMLARSVVQFILDSTGSTVVYRFKDSSGNNQSGLYAVAVP